MVRGTSVLVPPLGGKVVRSTKRGMPGGQREMLDRPKAVDFEPMNLRTYEPIAPLGYANQMMQ